MHWAYSEINTKGYNHRREPKIDPAFLLISKGSLLGPQNPHLTKNGNRLEITWENNSTEGKAQPTDETFVVCYAPEEQKFVWLETKFRRISGFAMMELNLDQASYHWHVYLAFSQFNSKIGKCFLSD